jgi:hypothetical protein
MGRKSGIWAGLCIALMLAGMVLLAPALAATTATDNFLGPNALGGDEPTDSGTNENATMEAGEPTVVDGVSVGHSVWETWTAPGPGTVTVDTCLSDFDTALAAYTGNSVSVLTPVQENDDAIPPCPIAEPGADAQASRIIFPVATGATYHIAITGKGSETGEFQLRLNFEPPPGNDDFAAAAQLSGNSTGASALNVGASEEAGEPDHSGNAGGASIWWRWTAPRSGPVAIDTCLSNFDTLLGIYTGPNVGALTQVAANDDSAQCPGPHTASKAGFAAEAGTTYWIGVDGANAGSGPQVGHVQLNLVSPTGKPTLEQPLLPDLVPAPAKGPGIGDLGTAKTYEKGGKKLLNVGFRIRNVGAGPLEVFPEVEDTPDDCNGNGDPEDDRIALQNYYLDSNGDGVFERDVDTDVRTRAAGCNAFHPEHGHWHSEVVGNALISEPAGQTVASLEKITFCLTDWTVDDAARPGWSANAYYPLGNCDQVSLQGISVGWLDQYSAGYASQDMEIGSLPAGDYCIRTSVDLAGDILEESKANNVADRRVHLDPSQSPPALDFLEGPCQFETPPTKPAANPPSNVPPQPQGEPSRSAPSTTISQLAIKQSTRQVTVRFKGDEPAASSATLRFECELDGGRFARCASPKAYTHVSVGRHTIKVRAVDAAGSMDPSPAARRFRIQAQRG